MTQEKKTNMYNAAYGMRVSHERIVDWGLHTIIHHIEIEAPGYELTKNGPKLIDPKTTGFANDEE